MDPKLLKIGGYGAIIYAVSTGFFYAYLAWRWPMVERQDAEAVLKEVGAHPAEWQFFWWSAIILSFSLMPTFPALVQALWKDAQAYAIIALFFGFIAIILGTLGPLRHATITPTLASLYGGASSEEIRGVVGVIYKTQEAYGQGLFCLFGST
ncbi:MAG TPA: DUF4386 family protein [Candidatus Avalokitesvara rifleensis]|uniref:DUF4386 family protein n=1 Tax=Candidatus Avalokitesvara rifleensis TaxID=3367620 RepID=UPI004029C44F